jgi:ribonuclease T2
MGSRVQAFLACFALIAFVAPVPASAQSLWDRLFGGASTPARPPCVLDNCNPSAPAAPDAPALPRVAAPSAMPPGAFDFYLLTLSWSPGFCDSGGSAKSPDQCSVGSDLASVVHGLWPQFDRGYPSDCNPNAPQPSSIALALTRGVFPNDGLARYEWRKHGTCTGLSPQAYFADVKRARDEIVIPDALQAPREPLTLSPIEITRAFAAVNPGLRADNMAVGCLRGELQDVKICLSKDLRAFANCDEVARGTCRALAVNIPPIN